jgi:transposase
LLILFMKFRELTDDESRVISAFLPPKPKRGRRASSDDGSKPIAVAFSPGNTHDSKMFNHLYYKMKHKPERIYGDSACDVDEIRAKLEKDGVQADIPVNRRNGRRQIPYGEKGYRAMRSAIERFNAWLKTFRRAIIRYERLVIMFQAIVTFACIMIHMRYGL